MTTPTPAAGNRMPTEEEFRSRIKAVADTGQTVAEASEGFGRLGEFLRAQSGYFKIVRSPDGAPVSLTPINDGMEFDGTSYIIREEQQ